MRNKRRRNIGAIIMILVGLTFLLKDTFGVLKDIDWNYVWPMILIIIGVNRLLK